MNYINKFRFDHLRRQASEYEPYQTDEEAEPWRLALEKQLTEYIKERFTYGTCMVIGESNADTIILSAFIESHKFEPRNFWYASLILGLSFVFVCCAGMVPGDQNGH